MTPYRPIINEIFPSSGILFQNKYINSERRTYFINKIYKSGINAVEIGSFCKDQPFINGTREISNNINNSIFKSSHIKFCVNSQSLTHESKPIINQLVYSINVDNEINKEKRGLSTNELISLFNENKKLANDIGITCKLLVEGDKHEELPYIVYNTQPHFLEVEKITHYALKLPKDINYLSLRVRNNDFNEVDKAYYEYVFRYSSSLIKTSDYMETIDLIMYLRTKLGVNVPTSLTMLKEIKEEVQEEFNW
jgi:hypothetical protein